MIDLHLHTNASDGLLGPDALVRLAAQTGIRTLSVTDHDTVASVPDVAAAARACGMAVVPGIEITAVIDTLDVHVLGYFIDPGSDLLDAFLVSQRASRVERAQLMGARLAALGCPIDIDSVLRDSAANPERAVARPRIAAELVRAGHVRHATEAFDRLIGEDRPAYVPRRGASPADVVRLIRSTGGVASLAHPGVLDRDDLIEGLVEAGLGALEVYHSDHDEAARAHYAALARRYDLAVTGGSDFHGDDGHHAPLGSVSLSQEEFERLCARAAWRP